MASGKYEVAINGFTCIGETWDDALNRDGNHDEVYFVVNTKVVSGQSSTTLINSDAASSVLGDVNNFPGRIQAGSGTTWWGTASGGLMGGDSYPSSTPWLQITDPTGRDIPPYTIWQGELREGDDKVTFLTPTIWELDIGGDAMQGWVDWQVRTDATFGMRAKDVYGKIWPVAMPFFDAVSLGIQTFATIPGMWNPSGQPRSRPIGLQRDPANPDGTLFNPLIIALTYETAEYLMGANLFGKGQGIIAHRYFDDPMLRGDYQIWFQIKKIGGANGWPDGSVLREASGSNVYVVYGGAKFWIPDPATLFRLFPTGWSVVQMVPDGALSGLGAAPSDGSILREEHSAYVYLIEAGTKRHISTPAALRRYGGWPMVHVVPDFGLDKLPIGQPIV
jgi:hypothetical protein